jgi:hypothetical protein
MRRFFCHWRPDVGLIAESELWPNMIVEAGKADLPLMLLNGRMSDKSYQRWSKQERFARVLLGRFDVIVDLFHAGLHRLDYQFPIGDVRANRPGLRPTRPVGADPRVRPPHRCSSTPHSNEEATMNKRNLAAFLALTLAPLSAGALAHHGWSWYGNEDFTLTAVVVEKEFGNPHDRMTVEADGQRWNLLLSPPSRSRRISSSPFSTKLFKPRSVVTVQVLGVANVLTSNSRSITGKNSRCAISCSIMARVSASSILS